MAEGGRFPWKLQKIFQVPSMRNERLRGSLPKPPEGMAWLQNKETREWKLVPEHEVAQLEGAEQQPPPSQQQQQQQQQEAEGVESAAEVCVDFQDNKDAFANPFNVPQGNQDEAAKNQQANLQASEVTEATETASNVHATSNLPFASKRTHIENMPTGGDESNIPGMDDWEMLSDRTSLRGTSQSSINDDGMAFVTRNGSIRSTSSHHGSDSLLSGGYKMQRTPSSSTIDSNDFHLGPSGKGILGVDYVEHVILPTDTFQGICLAYKITASKLRRANHFSGESLTLAPKRLIIPISKKAIQQGYLRVQDTDSREYKLHAIQAEFPSFGLAEARAYLELSDWNLRDACQSAREDNDWETDLKKQGKLRSGEIRVMMNVQQHPDGPFISFQAQGAGYSPSKKKQNTQIKPVSYETGNAKAVKIEDIHSAAPQHNSYGVEMQALTGKTQA